MKSILEMFANDEIQVSSRYYEHSKEYQQKENEMDKIRRKILDKLDREGKDLFDDYESVKFDLQGITRANEFVYGYQIGALMMIEVYSILDSPALNE